MNRRKDLYRPEETEKAWSDAADVVKVYSDDMIKRWNAEIDTYLVYVRGLPVNCKWSNTVLPEMNRPVSSLRS